MYAVSPSQVPPALPQQCTICAIPNPPQPTVNPCNCLAPLQINCITFSFPAMTTPRFPATGLSGYGSCTFPAADVKAILGGQGSSGVIGTFVGCPIGDRSCGSILEGYTHGTFTQGGYNWGWLIDVSCGASGISNSWSVTYYIYLLAGSVIYSTLFSMQTKGFTCGDSTLEMTPLYSTVHIGTGTATVVHSWDLGAADFGFTSEMPTISSTVGYTYGC